MATMGPVRGVGALLVCVVVLCVGAVAAFAYVYGPTPMAVALAATNKFAAHQVKAWNRPQVSYTLGTCRVLHRKPWLAYNCTFELHGVPLYCHGLVTVGVRRLADGKYRGQAVRSSFLDNRGC